MLSIGRRGRRNPDTDFSKSEDEFTTADLSTIQTQYHKHKIFSHQVYENRGWAKTQLAAKKKRPIVALCDLSRLCPCV